MLASEIDAVEYGLVTLPLSKTATAHHKAVKGLINPPDI